MSRLKVSYQNGKRFVGDVALNLIATAVPLFILQLVILPGLATMVGEEQYGQIVTITSVFMLVSGSFGSALNNSRLISNELYENEHVTGDYNFFLVVLTAVNAVIVLAFTYLLSPQIDMVDLIIAGLIACVNLMIQYGNVHFRLALNYKKVMINSILLAAGYAVGYLLFRFSGRWVYVYLFGFIFSSLFIINTTNMVQEGLRRTKLFPVIQKQVLYLLGSSILVSASVYLDRIILYPILGGAQVAIYFSATAIPKMISLVADPITGVILSYLAKMKEISKSRYLRVFLLLLMIGVVGYFVIIIVTPFILSLLYPQYQERAVKYIPITGLTTIIIVCCNMLNALAIRFRSIKWQLILNASYVAMSLLLAILGNLVSGMEGFCVGLLIAAVLKLITLILVLLYRK